MTLDPSSVARTFRLGTPTAPLRPLPGLSRAGVWALSTDRGEWVVKASAAVSNDALRLERAARAAGVTTARAVPGPEGEATTVRVWERVAGGPPTVPASAELAAWLGRTVATIAGLGLPATTPSTVDSYADAGLADLADLALTARPPMVLCHRDINRRNILLTAAGPVLLDFENAGPQAPWWELVHHTFLLSCADLGPEEPDPATIQTAVRAYREQGGEPGPTDRTAFAGLAAGLLVWARSDPLAAASRLPLIARSLDRWCTLLEC